MRIKEATKEMTHLVLQEAVMLMNVPHSHLVLVHHFSKQPENRLFKLYISLVANLSSGTTGVGLADIGSSLNSYSSVN